MQDRKEVYIISIDNINDNSSHFQLDAGISRKFDLVAFFFTLVIVIYHSDAELKQYYSESYLQPSLSSVYGYLAGMAMSFFFLKTGYFLYLNADIHNIRHKLKRRIKTVLIPFLIWNTAYFLGGLLIHGIKNNIGTVLYRYTFDPYDAPLWYLPAILALALLAPMVLLCRNRWIQLFIGIAVTGVSIAVSGFGLFEKINVAISPELVIWIKRLCSYLPSYILGAFAGMRKLNPAAKKKGIRIFAGVIFAYLVCGWIITILKSNFAFLNEIRVLSFFNGPKMIRIPSGVQVLLATVSFWFLLSSDCNHDSNDDTKHDPAYDPCSSSKMGPCTITKLLRAINHL